MKKKYSNDDLEQLLKMISNGEMVLELLRQSSKLEIEADLKDVLQQFNHHKQALARVLPTKKALPHEPQRNVEVTFDKYLTDNDCQHITSLMNLMEPYLLQASNNKIISQSVFTQFNDVKKIFEVS